jgi:hypothetical protein
MSKKLTPEILDEMIEEAVSEHQAKRVLKEASKKNTISVKLTRGELKQLITEVIEYSVSKAGEVLLAQPPSSLPPTTGG